ncbi:hypothetical protein CLOM_g20044 [Closterium sp. NIES-68]|nr:hypothetical protein CLOM_g20044 [Closterium sp. NIES-68]GJP73918.1 hypothetical protein CLOP_g4585 [Closterium sp. NIES-67]
MQAVVGAGSLASRASQTTRVHPPIRLRSASSVPFQLRPSQLLPPPANTLQTPPCGAACRGRHASNFSSVPRPVAHQHLHTTADAVPDSPFSGCSAVVAERAGRRGRRGRVRVEGRSTVGDSGWGGVGSEERQQGSDVEGGRDVEEGKEFEGKEFEGKVLEVDGEEGEEEDELVEGGSVSLDNGFQFFPSDHRLSDPENRAASEVAEAAAAAAAAPAALAGVAPALPESTSSSTSSDSTTAISSSDTIGSSGSGSSSRAGLYRVPVSGGVQSATAAHGLPSPAVAVRNLVEQAGFAHLCSIMSRMHHRRKGYPFGSLVDFATDDEGHPIFLLSPLSIHTRNILADPRCTLVVQIPGWSGLANARATIFGDVYPVPPSQQQWAQRFFARRHQHGAAQMWGNFSYYRMQHICDIYFVGGFGTVAWIDVKDYLAATPDAIVLQNTEATLHELNVRLGSDLKRQLASILPQPVDDALFISIDGKGVDIRVRNGAKFNVQRLSFNSPSEVQSTEDAVAALHHLLRHGVTPVSNGMLQ